MKKRTRRAAAILLLLGVSISVGWMGWRDTTQPILHTVYVEVPGLRREYRILQVTDLHSGMFGVGQAAIAALVAGRRFDAVVMTGDLVLAHGETAEPALELARALTRTSAVLAFTKGNHDDSTVGQGLAELGVAYLDTTGPVRADGLLLESPALPATTTDNAALLIIAAHDPPSPDALAKMTHEGSPPTLVLSGHTHGGQFRLPLLGGIICPPTDQTEGKFLLLPELRGVRVEGAFRDGLTESYISPGLGSSKMGYGLPSWVRFRLGERAELTEIVVRGPSPDGSRQATQAR